MDASINSVPFYEANGFISLELGEHPLPSGNRMACMRMRKAILSSDYGTHDPPVNVEDIVDKYSRTLRAPRPRMAETGKRSR